MEEYSQISHSYMDTLIDSINEMNHFFGSGCLVTELIKEAEDEYIPIKVEIDEILEVINPTLAKDIESLTTIRDFIESELSYLKNLI
jgi:hypothetical protein